MGLPWWLSGKEICFSMQETQVQPLGQEDPPEKERATHSSNPMERGAWWVTKSLDPAERLHLMITIRNT